MTKTLLNLYKRIFWNTFRYAPFKTKLTYILAGIVIGGLVIFFGTIIGGSASLLPDEFISLIFSYLFAILIAMIILMGVPQVFNDLYSAAELEHLFTLPIKTRNIFYVKYLQSFISVPGSVWLISVVFLTIYGIFSGASLIFYPVAYLSFLAIVLIGMALAYLLNLVLVQIIPPHRAKELMTVMSLLAGLFAYGMIQLPNLFMTSSEGEGEDLLVNLPSLPEWLPFTWAAKAISEAKIGSFNFLLPLILILALAIVLIFLATRLVEKGFRTGWIRMNEGSGKKKSRRRKKGQKKVKLLKKLPHPILATMKKEWLMIKRDLREMLVFLPILVFMLIPFASIIFNGEIRAEIVQYPDISWLVVQWLMFFIFLFFGPTFAASTISREGKATTVLNVLPINSWHLTLGKYFTSLLLPLLVISVMQAGIGIVLNWSVFQIVFGIFIISLFGIGANAIGIFFGTLGAIFNESNPQQRLKFGVSVILMIVTSIYFAISLIPIAIGFIPLELIVSEEGWAVADGGVTGFIALLANWKMDNVFIVKSLAILILGMISFGVAAISLLLTTNKIKTGLNIEIVSKK